MRSYPPHCQHPITMFPDPYTKVTRITPSELRLSTNEEIDQVREQC